MDIMFAGNENYRRMAYCNGKCIKTKLTYSVSYSTCGIQLPRIISLVAINKTVLFQRVVKCFDD